MTRDDTERIAPERSVRGDIDPKLVAISAQITSMPIDARLRQIEAEANFFAGVRPSADALDPGTPPSDASDGD